MYNTTQIESTKTVTPPIETKRQSRHLPRSGNSPQSRAVAANISRVRLPPTAAVIPPPPRSFRLTYPTRQALRQALAATPKAHQSAPKSPPPTLLCICRNSEIKLPAASPSHPPTLGGCRTYAAVGSRN